MRAPATHRDFPRAVLPALGLLTVSAVLSAQTTGLPGGPPAPSPDSDVLTRIQGEVLDLYSDFEGRVLYCTSEGEVGRIDPGRPPGTRREILLPAGSIQSSAELVALAIDTAGDIMVLGDDGDLYLVSEANAAMVVYDDLWMIQDATDLVIDEDDNFVIASATPSNGQRGVNRISSDGVDWGYVFVDRSPIQLAADPLTRQIFYADQTGSGSLRRFDTAESTFPESVVDWSPNFDFSAADDDGDLICDIAGNVYIADETRIWFHDRAQDVTTPFASGYAGLHGIAIGRSTDTHGDGFWSLYVAEGANPTTLREVKGVLRGANPIAASVGPVPDEGRYRLSGPANQILIQTIAADNDGKVLLGGHLWGANFQILRYDPATGSTTQVAHQSDGLSDVVTGLAVAADDTIYALTRDGNIDRITENPVVVTNVYTDVVDRIGHGFHLALDVDGTFYVADRGDWGSGELVEISADGSTITPLIWVPEARGVTADPAGGGVFLTIWNNSGFAGEVKRYDFGTGQLEVLPGFDGLNYSNATADGDTVVDVDGNIYSVSEDDWSTVRWEPEVESFTRIGSAYERSLSGVEIAPSTPGVGSTTGWSLYVSTIDQLFEIASVPAPAPDLVDSSALFTIGPQATLDSHAGRPRDLLATADGLVVSSAGGVLQAVDAETGDVLRIAGPEHGLSGDLVDVERAHDGSLVVATRAGRFFRVETRGERVRVDPLFTAPAGTVLSGFVLDPAGRPLALVASEQPGATLFTLLGPFGARRLGLLPGALRPVLDPLTGRIRLRPTGTPRRAARGAATYQLEGWHVRELREDTFPAPFSRARAAIRR